MYESHTDINLEIWRCSQNYWMVMLLYCLIGNMVMVRFIGPGCLHHHFFVCVYFVFNDKHHTYLCSDCQSVCKYLIIYYL